MDDDIDIYEDLLELKDNEIPDEGRTDDKYVELNSKIIELNEKIHNLEKVNTNLERNLSSLLKTAKSEIARKERVINDLRKQIDNAAFRRGNFAHRKKPFNSNEIADHEQQKSVNIFDQAVENIPVKTEENVTFVNNSVRASVLPYNDDHNDDDATDATSVQSVPCTLYGERLLKKIKAEQEMDKILTQDSQQLEKGKVVESDKENRSEPPNIKNIHVASSLNFEKSTIQEKPFEQKSSTCKIIVSSRKRMNSDSESTNHKKYLKLDDSSHEISSHSKNSNRLDAKYYNEKHPSERTKQNHCKEKRSDRYDKDDKKSQSVRMDERRYDSKLKRSSRDRDERYKHRSYFKEDRIRETEEDASRVVNKRFNDSYRTGFKSREIDACHTDRSYFREQDHRSVKFNKYHQDRDRSQRSFSVSKNSNGRTEQSREYEKNDAKRKCGYRQSERSKSYDSNSRKYSNGRNQAGELCERTISVTDPKDVKVSDKFTEHIGDVAKSSQRQSERTCDATGSNSAEVPNEPKVLEEGEIPDSSESFRSDACSGSNRRSLDVPVGTAAATHQIPPEENGKKLRETDDKPKTLDKTEENRVPVKAVATDDHRVPPEEESIENIERLIENYNSEKRDNESPPPVVTEDTLEKRESPDPTGKLVEPVEIKDGEEIESIFGSSTLDCSLKATGDNSERLVRASSVGNNEEVDANVDEKNSKDVATDVEDSRQSNAIGEVLRDIVERVSRDSSDANADLDGGRLRSVAAEPVVPEGMESQEKQETVERGSSAQNVDSSRVSRNAVNTVEDPCNEGLESVAVESVAQETAKFREKQETMKRESSAKSVDSSRVKTLRETVGKVSRGVVNTVEEPSNELVGDVAIESDTSVVPDVPEKTELEEEQDAIQRVSSVKDVDSKVKVLRETVAEKAEFQEKQESTKRGVSSALKSVDSKVRILREIVGKASRDAVNTDGDPSNERLKNSAVKPDRPDAPEKMESKEKQDRIKRVSSAKGVDSKSKMLEEIFGNISCDTSSTDKESPDEDVAVSTVVPDGPDVPEKMELRDKQDPTFKRVPPLKILESRSKSDENSSLDKANAAESVAIGQRSENKKITAERRKNVVVVAAAAVENAEKKEKPVKEARSKIIVFAKRRKNVHLSDSNAAMKLVIKPCETVNNNVGESTRDCKNSPLKPRSCKVSRSYKHIA